MPNESEILREIATLQIKEDNPYFPIGSFASFRNNRSLNYQRPDNNVFGTASTVFVLQETKDLFGEENKLLVEKITQKAVGIYPLYQNKDSLPTYNFWQTNPSRHFPHGNILQRFEHFKLPDDIDDTALVYATKPHSEAENRWLKEKLTHHTQLAGDQKKYVYSTWFGENMPIEQDVCALCNLLYWVFENQLPLDEHDHATLRFLREKIVSDEFLTNPFTTARHYATVPLILYHYARLIYKFNSFYDFDYKEIITEKASKLLSDETSPMNRVLLTTVLLKLTLQSDIPRVEVAEPDDRFHSFIGAFLAPYVHMEEGVRTNSFFQAIAAHTLTRFNWKCPAHELALQLENVVLRRVING